jgi:hypothetical protein
MRNGDCEPKKKDIMIGRQIATQKFGKLSKGGKKWGFHWH